jgi:hypothetical protein
MTMKATSMPFCHSSNTIKVYKGYCKEHGTNISHAFINNDLVTTFHLMEKEVQKKGKAYLVLNFSKGYIE